MKYDDASWHYNGTFPEGSPPEYGGTHIALFLKWCFIKGWAGEIHLDDEPEAVNAVIDGSMTASDFFYDYCDGKFTDEDLNDLGNQFAEMYYGAGGAYLEDFADNFADELYERSEADHDFQKFSEMMDRRFEEWSTPKVVEEKKWFQRFFDK